MVWMFGLEVSTKRLQVQFYFRQIEKKIIKNYLLKGYAVISTGGGAFEQAATRALIKQQAISVWLSVDSCHRPRLLAH